MKTITFTLKDNIKITPLERNVIIVDTSLRFSTFIESAEYQEINDEKMYLDNISDKITDLIKVNC